MMMNIDIPQLYYLQNLGARDKHIFGRQISTLIKNHKNNFPRYNEANG